MFYFKYASHQTAKNNHFLLFKVLRRIRVQSLHKIEDVLPVVEIITRPHCGVMAKLYPR